MAIASMFPGTPKSSRLASHPPSPGQVGHCVFFYSSGVWEERETALYILSPLEQKPLPPAPPWIFWNLMKVPLTSFTLRGVSRGAQSPHPCLTSPNTAVWFLSLQGIGQVTLVPSTWPSFKLPHRKGCIEAGPWEPAHRSSARHPTKVGRSAQPYLLLRTFCLKAAHF